MSVLRSPTGSGLTAGRSGSQPNLASSESFLDLIDDKRAITIRNKRKQPDDDNQIKEDLCEIRNRMVQMMEIITTLSIDQKKYMNKISEDITSIKEELNEIKNITKTLEMEQNTIKSDIANLKEDKLNIEKKINTLVTDVVHLKHQQEQPMINSVESTLKELKEREDRSKNIIIIGVPEPSSLDKDERKKVDRNEVLKITRISNAECPEPTYMARLGKYNSDKNRPIKVGYQSQETVKCILRNRNSIKSKDIKIFSDQTPLQQSYMRTLKEELKDRAGKGEKDLIIKYIKGVPKITKISPKN